MDDDTEVAALTADVFAICGAQATIAASKSEAIGLLCSRTFELVIMDLSAPELDGRNVLDFIRAVCPVMLARTILLTARRYDLAMMKDIVATGLPCVLKPFHVDDLRNAACTLLSDSKSGLAA